jgi:hypothetical protein
VFGGYPPLSEPVRPLKAEEKLTNAESLRGPTFIARLVEPGGTAVKLRIRHRRPAILAARD